MSNDALLLTLWDSSCKANRKMLALAKNLAVLPELLCSTRRGLCMHALLPLGLKASGR